MFTGIVETMGTIAEIVPMDTTSSGGGGFSMTIGNADVVLSDVHIGDSIAVNGVCLTVTEYNDARTSFKVGIAPETIRKTNFGDLKTGEKVNLERAMLASTRFGGHFVQGHVDTTVRIHSITPDPPNSLIMRFTVPKPSETGNIDYLRYIIPKGFISLDGTSLTVVDVDNADRTFSVMLIAHTQQHVILPQKKPGEKVNVEVDQVGKYVEKVAVGMLQGNGEGDSVFSEMIKKIVDDRVKQLLSATQ
ncbi:riboflavin synthase, alpha subunit [Spizellomyces punctatus DAOM BR117]|uniref:Riboflavin synthase n=1 Tax=Spizellomyces punctatus (strain DAOM BR117) TaxID=645134 RepID=A0A0L0HIF2_SPIPD|nr:riboflavin synthase, alpha subunit [Spizellomyces punctatus DAOM BR117]KND00907.1 riboflavin synthase, alpha subunit [Spizellomyces punctatus DAOM BR117]|eukprot:XP_016608946.1 riboflavin synthase, alpha subunit [Spizellomyces punctatus DAOM BR117]